GPWRFWLFFALPNVEPFERHSLLDGITEFERRMFNSWHPNIVTRTVFGARTDLSSSLALERRRMILLLAWFVGEHNRAKLSRVFFP
ncbi:hypothetical protein B0H10DRAFT_2080867, partial [Mycena sp. CBHHK59/15]